MEPWYASIYKAFITGAAIAFIIRFFTSGTTAYNSYIAGDSILILAIMMILIMIIAKGLRATTPNTSNLQLVISMLLQLGPFLIMLGIIAFTLYLNVTYKDPILENHVSQSYYTFSNITII